MTIKLVKSLIGSKKDQIATDNAQTKGKVAKIIHLVEVSEA